MRRHVVVAAALLALLLAGRLGAAPPDAGELYQLGLDRYEANDYRGAVEVLSRAADLRPHVAHYHHALGRAYGRLAEQAGWLEAVGLAQKSRMAFERAVALDGTDIAALADLMRFYEQAPVFLGGSPAGAERIRERLERLCSAEAAGAGACIDLL